MNESLASELQTLAQLESIVRFNLKLAKSKSGGKGYVYDIALLPEGWTPADVIKDAKKNPGKYPGYDLGLVNTIKTYESILKQIHKQMKSVMKLK